MRKRTVILLGALILAMLACRSLSPPASTYENKDFTFSAPQGYKTTPYITPYFDRFTHSEELLFSGVGRYPYFVVYRRPIPTGSDLESVLSDYKETLVGSPYSAEIISQTPTTLKGRNAIELVHREFHGEPYVQTREVWMEQNGWAYSLVCVTPVTAAPGAVIPVSEKCIELAEGFQFK
jgi:hypothetical protein